MNQNKDGNPTYYYIDVNVSSGEIVAWRTESKDQAEARLPRGCHRVFLTKGQYNKLERRLRES